MSEPANVLVAEDDPSDAFFLARAFEKTGGRIVAHFVRDGQEASDYLKGVPPFSNRQAHPFPRLLVLDLKMPRMDGFEVLEWLRRQPGLRRLPVVVLSGSELSQDVNRAYDLGANSFLVKPHVPADLVALVEKLDDYWLGANYGGDSHAPGTNGTAA